MQRIDVASATAMLPTPAAAGTPGYFTDGDPVGGQAATVLPADFVNMLQEELMAPVLAAGLTPSKTNRSQVLAALTALLGIVGNLASTGHIAIPIGTQKLIINWGNSATTDTSGLKNVTFDAPFATGVLFAMAGNLGTGIPTAFHNVGTTSKTGMDVRSASASGTPAGNGTAFSYIAIGV